MRPISQFEVKAIASAVARRLASTSGVARSLGAARTGSSPNAIASAVVRRLGLRGRRPNLPEAIASAVARRLAGGSKETGGVPVGSLASAIVRRLAETKSRAGGELPLESESVATPTEGKPDRGKSDLKAGKA